MKKIGIFYGSSTGTCEDLAHQIAGKLNVSEADIYSAKKLSAELVSKYEVLILGTSTWGDGEMQDDWYDGIKALKAADLSGKEVALFGCGDSESYADTFCDGMGAIYDAVKDKGCSIIGNHVDAGSYNYSSSTAVVDGYFVGLALDEINESEKTASRIEEWTGELKQCL